MLFNGADESDEVPEDDCTDRNLLRVLTLQEFLHRRVQPALPLGKRPRNLNSVGIMAAKADTNAKVEL